MSNHMLAGGQVKHSHANKCSAARGLSIMLIVMIILHSRVLVLNTVADRFVQERIARAPLKPQIAC